MAYTGSDVFTNIKGIVDSKVHTMPEIVQIYIEEQERVTPFDNYNVWSEANQRFNIFSNDSFISIANQILMIHLLYIYSHGNTISRNALQKKYYNQGISVVNNMINNMFNSSDDVRDKNIHSFLSSFANLTGPPNQRFLTTCSLFNKKLTRDFMVLNRLASTMIVNDYLNPRGLESFGNKISTIVSQLLDKDLNGILNMNFDSFVSNKTQFLIDQLALTEKELKILYITLRDDFEHWLLSYYNPLIDTYYVRTRETDIYAWLDSLDIIETIVILNEWSKDMSLDNLLNQLDPNVYNLFLEFIDPAIRQNKMILSDKDPMVKIMYNKQCNSKPRYNRKCKHWKSKFY